MVFIVIIYSDATCSTFLHLTRESQLNIEQGDIQWYFEDCGDLFAHEQVHTRALPV